jgi:hypothetical protein
MVSSIFVTLTTALVLGSSEVAGFAVNRHTTRSQPLLSTSSQQQNHGVAEGAARSFAATVAAASIFAATTLTLTSPVQPVFAAGEPAEIRGTKLSPLNSLAFQYRGSDFNGLDGASIQGPSIKYSDFLDKLTAGDVTFVEFLAPSGDEAYATLKGGERIRIGQGFPVEQYDGWSSPAFAIRSVKEKGVPYKFVVPGLDKYKQL